MKSIMSTPDPRDPDQFNPNYLYTLENPPDGWPYGPPPTPIPPPQPAAKPGHTLYPSGIMPMAQAIKKPTPQTQDELKKAFEDKVLADVNDLDEVSQAYVYLVLNRQGLRIDNAEATVAKTAYELVDCGREVKGTVKR